LIRKPISIPRRFVKEVIEGLRRERSAEVAAAVRAVIGPAPNYGVPGYEAPHYFALCERAWLHWSRLALDAITTHTLGQVTLGTFDPAYVRGSEDAARAHARCGLHVRLLDVASQKLARADPHWTWRAEAARQVHASTGDTLRVAVAINNPQLATARELDSGIRAAVDALVTAIAAGFVVNGPIEVLQTVEAMVAAGETASPLSG
jgi:hypothetical protein